MGNMKWIYSMVTDGSYDRFKQLYIKCVLTDSTSFNFSERTYVKSFAKSVVKYVDEHKLLEKYDEHIEVMADKEYESQFLDV
tara:strand:+ start:1787 stop:2032 length:246 start_codon:yes stop_codon:yes gene_type:complete